MVRWLVALVCLLFVGCSEPISPTLEVTPGEQTLASGQSLQLTVTRRYPGNSVEVVTNKVSYESSQKLTAAVNTNNGLVTAGNLTGPAIIRIVDPTSDAVVTTTLNVVASAIESIDITPAPAVVLKKNEKRQFTATAHLSNGATADVTGVVAWSASDPTVADVGNTSEDKGIVSAFNSGTTEIQARDPQTGVIGRTTAFVNDVTTLAAIVVSPNPAAVKSGEKVQLTARGILANGTTVDLSKSVTWDSSGNAFATVDLNGLVSGIQAGQVTITAIGAAPNTSIRGSTQLTITNP